MSRVRVGKLVFRDPVLLCGVVYLLLYFDASGFLRLGLLAAVLHELGHIFVYCIQQRHLPVIEVTMTGFCMHTAGERLSPRQRFVLAAAGPAVNFALAWVWAVRLAQTTTIRGSAFWAANLLTGTPVGHSACCNVYCGTQVAIQEQIEADEAKIALGVLGGFAVLVTVLALAVSGS